MFRFISYFYAIMNIFIYLPIRTDNDHYLANVIINVIVLSNPFSSTEKTCRQLFSPPFFPIITKSSSFHTHILSVCSFWSIAMAKNYSRQRQTQKNYVYRVMFNWQYSIPLFLFFYFIIFLLHQLLWDKTKYKCGIWWCEGIHCLRQWVNTEDKYAFLRIPKWHQK